VPDTTRDPFALTAGELQRLLAGAAPLIPELAAARDQLDALRAAPQAQLVLAQTAQLMQTIELRTIFGCCKTRGFGWGSTRSTSAANQLSRPAYI